MRETNGTVPPPPPAQQDDRRGALRYSTICHRLLLGWWEGDEYRTTDALLKDLSLTGASLLAETLPPLETAVWICLQESPQFGWIEMTVVDAEVVRRGMHVLRVTFPASCPFDFFKAAIANFGTERPVPPRPKTDRP